MENADLLRRLADLAERCDRTGSVTATPFLTPAEQFEMRKRCSLPEGVTLLFSGGSAECERQCAFFLPYYLDEAGFDVSETIKAIRIRSYYGEVTHRDYLGSLLALGIRREWLGDIRLDGDTAWVFCLASVEKTLLDVDRVGRCSVKAEACALEDVPVPEKKVKTVNFTVKSLRLDAVTGDLFGVSRTAAAEAIRLGAVSLNYAPCTQPDAPVREGDILSFRGKGKGSITEIGGQSRKDRTFVRAELRL